VCASPTFIRRRLIGLVHVKMLVGEIFTRGGRNEESSDDGESEGDFVMILSVRVFLLRISEGLPVYTEIMLSSP
jgi:hypothetical protein